MTPLHFDPRLPILRITTLCPRGAKRKSKFLRAGAGEGTRGNTASQLDSGPARGIVNLITDTHTLTRGLPCGEVAPKLAFTRRILSSIGSLSDVFSNLEGGGGPTMTAAKHEHHFKVEGKVNGEWRVGKGRKGATTQL